MGHRKSQATDSKKDVAPGERNGMIFTVISSKWVILLILILAGIVWYGFYATHTKEVAGSDDREYASIARNIVNGKGIARNFIYPVDINFFEKLPIPEFMHPPGYPLIIAGFFKIFGISESVALLPSYLSYFLLLTLSFFFAKRFVDVRTGTIAVVILLFSREILDLSSVALSEIVYAVAFFSFFIFFVRAKSILAIFISGILLGVSHLIRENIYPFLIPLFVHLYFYPNLPRWQKMVIFVIGFLIPLVPNMVRSYIGTGSPFFSYGKFILMTYTEKYPWMNVCREIQNPSLFTFLMEEPGQFFYKYISNLVQILEQIMLVSNPYVLAFFFIELFHWKVSPDWRRVKILFLFLLISQILFISLFTLEHRYFIPFLPLMAVMASQSFLRLSEDLVSGARTLWKKRVFFLTIFLFLIFFVIPSIYTILKPYKPSVLGFKTPQFGFLVSREEANRLNDFLRRELKEDQIVWTDLPEILDWEGDRLCGWLPTKIEYIYKIHKKIPVDAILLTSLRTPYKMEEEWKYLLFSEYSLPRYRTVKLYKSGLVFAKLLIRDEKE